MQTYQSTTSLFRKPGIAFSLSQTNIRRFTNIIPISRKSSQKVVTFLGNRRHSALKQVVPRNIFLKKEILKQNNYQQFSVNEILEKIKTTVNDNEKNSRKYISQKEMVENYYRNMIFVQIKTLNKYTEQKQNIEKELASYQRELEMYKLKTSETNAKLQSFRILCESNSSLSLYSKYISEKEESNKLINNYNNKIIFIEKNIKYTLSSLQQILSEIKSLQSIKTHNVKQLIQYYLMLLNEFNDFRIDGISWIFYKLIELGYDINKCIRPSCINDKYWNYLKQVARDKIYLEELRIIYRAIRVKFIKKKDYDGLTITTTTNSGFNELQSRTVSTAVSKDESKCNMNTLPIIKENNNRPFYDKFLEKYIQQQGNPSRNKFKLNKNFFYYFKYFEQEELNLKTENYTEREDKDDKQLKLRDFLPKDIIDEVSDIKNTYDKAREELKNTIKLWQVKYKSENEDLKHLDIEKYKYIFQAIFGKFTPI